MGNIIIQVPADLGSLIFNYTGILPIALMAALYAEYKFITVDIGTYISHSDSAAFQNIKFADKLKANRVDIHDPCTLCDDNAGEKNGFCICRG